MTEIPPIRTETTKAFEEDLKDLLLSAFGRGAAIEGEWTVTTPISSTPSWTVTIEKHDSESDPVYEPTLLDE